MSHTSSRNLRINPQNLLVQEEALSQDSQQSNNDDDVQFRDQISSDRNGYAEAEQAFRELRQLRRDVTAAARDISTLTHALHLERAQAAATLSELNDTRKNLSVAVRALNGHMLRAANDQQTIVRLQQENIQLKKDLREQL